MNVRSRVALGPDVSGIAGGSARRARSTWSMSERRAVRGHDGRWATEDRVRCPAGAAPSCPAFAAASPRRACGAARDGREGV